MPLDYDKIREETPPRTAGSKWMFLLEKARRRPGVWFAMPCVGNECRNGQQWLTKQEGVEAQQSAGVLRWVYREIETRS